MKFGFDWPSGLKNVNRPDGGMQDHGYIMSLVVRKLVFGVSDQVRHKPGCTATEDGLRLEISEFQSRGIVLSM